MAPKVVKSFKVLRQLLKKNNKNEFSKGELILSDDNKKVSLVIDEGKLKILVDANKDGEAVISIAVDLMEVADEVKDLILSKKKKD